MAKVMTLADAVLAARIELDRTGTAAARRRLNKLVNQLADAMAEAVVAGIRDRKAAPDAVRRGQRVDI